MLNVERCVSNAKSRVKYLNYITCWEVCAFNRNQIFYSSKEELVAFEEENVC